MRLHLPLGVLGTLVLCPAQICPRPPIPAGGLPLTLESHPVTYSDAYQTVGNLWRPDVPAPSCGWPLVVFVHRLGDSRFADLALQQFIAGQGYAVWAYDVRGQGQAQMLNVGHPNEGCTIWGETERFDLAEQILGATARVGWQGLVDATRVAIVGSSQGGVHAWNGVAWSGQPLAVTGRGAVMFPPIACAVAVDYVAEPVQDWLRGGQLWSTWFVNLISDDVVPPFVLSSSFKNAAASAFRAQDAAGLVAQWTAENRPIAARLPTSSVPVLYSHAYHDLIDSPLQTLQVLQGMTAPNRALLSTIGHNTPDNVHERVFRDALIVRWLDRWLWNHANEVELEVDDRFVMSAVPLERTQREDPNFAWTRVHRGDPLVAAAMTRFWLDDQGGPVLSPTSPATALTPVTIQQTITDPNFTASNYLALAANRDLAEVLADCPLSEQVFATTLASAQQLDAAVRVHLEVVPQSAEWMLAALLTVQEPGGDEVLLSSWGVASRASQVGVGESVEFLLPPVATVMAAGTTLRLRLRNLWLREFPLAQALEAAPLFVPFQVDVRRGDAATGSWIELPLVTPPPALVVESGVDVPVNTLPPVHLRIRGGAANAGRTYFISASLGGHLPRLPFLNGSLPLENDWLYGVIIGAITLPQFAGFLGDLHPVTGEGTAIMDLSAAAPLDPLFVGLRLSFAAWVFDDISGSSGVPTNPIDLFLR